MNRYPLILLACFFIAGIFVSCEKDSTFYTSDDQNTWTSDYAAQVEALLGQLTPEELAMLTPEDIAEFKKGPDQASMQTAERSSFRIRRTWHPTLMVYYCTADSGVVKGDGPWYGSGKASLLIHQDVMDQGKFVTPGWMDITAVNDYAIHFMFSAYPPRELQNGKISQYLRATAMSGTGTYIAPEGGLDLNVLIRSDREFSVAIIVRGWLYYGLNVDPVPRAFEQYFPTDFLMAHYACLENTPGAKPMYIETQNDFWVYPTTEPMTSAVKGIGEGKWNDKDVTFVIDHNLVGDFVNAPELVVGEGRFRVYMGTKDAYLDKEYLDMCFNNSLTPTGGFGYFDIMGGTESYFNMAGSGAGAMVEQSELVFGNIPPEGLFPWDLRDDGFRCEEYSNTECAGLCVPGGDPMKAIVYLIGCYYGQSQAKCMDITALSGVAQLDSPVVIILPDGRNFSGFGSLPVNMTVGGYDGTWQVVVLKEEFNGTGANYMLLEYFTDTKGNSFWSSGFGISTPVDAFTFNIRDNETVIGGTGEFDCARGIFRTGAVMHLDTYTLDFEVSGSMCMGCE